MAFGLGILDTIVVEGCFMNEQICALAHEHKLVAGPVPRCSRAPTALSSSYLQPPRSSTACRCCCRGGCCCFAVATSVDGHDSATEQPQPSQVLVSHVHSARFRSLSFGHISIAPTSIYVVGPLEPLSTWHTHTHTHTHTSPSLPCSLSLAPSLILVPPMTPRNSSRVLEVLQ